MIMTLVLALEQLTPMTTFTEGKGDLLDICRELDVA